jgi:hypothetical protein
MAIVRIAALDNQNRSRAGDAPYKIRPACVIVGAKDTVRFLNRTGVEVQVEAEATNPQLGFRQGARGAAMKRVDVPDANRVTIDHPVTPGRFRFRVTYENPPGSGFNTEIHAESSPEIIVDE